MLLIYVCVEHSSLTLAESVDFKMRIFFVFLLFLAADDALFLFIVMPA